MCGKKNTKRRGGTNKTKEIEFVEMDLTDLIDVLRQNGLDRNLRKKPRRWATLKFPDENASNRERTERRRKLKRDLENSPGFKRAVMEVLLQPYRSYPVYRDPITVYEDYCEGYLLKTDLKKIAVELDMVSEQVVKKMSYKRLVEMFKKESDKF